MSDWLTRDAWIHEFHKSYWGFRWDFVKWRLVSSEDTNIWLHAAMHTDTDSPYGLWWTGRYTDKMSFNRVFRAATLQIKVGYITPYRHMPQLWPEKTSVYFLSLQSVYLFSFQSFFVSSSRALSISTTEQASISCNGSINNSRGRTGSSNSPPVCKMNN